MIAEADALGITGRYGAELLLTSTDPADRLLLRARVQNATAARAALHQDQADAIAQAIAELFS